MDNFELKFIFSMFTIIDMLGIFWFIWSDSQYDIVACFGATVLLLHLFVSIYIRFKDKYDE